MHEASLVESLLDQIANSVRQWRDTLEVPSCRTADREGDVDAGNPADSLEDSPRPTRPVSELDAWLAQVSLVTLEIGPLAGVEPELMRLAFDRLAPARGLPLAKLEITWVPLTIRCDSCGVASEQRVAVFQCPACGGGRVTVERGDAVILKSIQLIDE